MIDIRYHVISLVSVLLALGIGILLGTTLVERGLVAEHKAEIESLKKTFGEIREKNKMLNEDLRVYSDFASLIKEYVLPGRLAGKTFVLIRGRGTSDSLVGSIYDAVTMAGGTIKASVNLSPSSDYGSREIKGILSSLFGIEGDENSLRSRAIDEVANQVVHKSSPALFAELERIGLLTVSGDMAGIFSGGIIAFDDADEKKEDVSKYEGYLARKLVEMGFPLLGAGGERASDEVMTVFRQSGISTVGMVDSPVGQVAMVLALEGRGGNFGRSSGAERLIPEPTG